MFLFFRCVRVISVYELCVREFDMLFISSSVFLVFSVCFIWVLENMCFSVVLLFCISCWVCFYFFLSDVGVIGGCVVRVFCVSGLGVGVGVGMGISVFIMMFLLCLGLI